MTSRDILKTIIVIILALLMVLALVYYALQSDFAKLNQRSGGSADGYKMKTKFYKEYYYSTKFKTDINNKNVVSLGHFAINIKGTDNSKLIIKVVIKTKDGSVDSIMGNQSVIRNDVIDSVANIRASSINPQRVSEEIKKGLNYRFRGRAIEDVYFDEFIVQ